MQKQGQVYEERQNHILKVRKAVSKLGALCRQRSYQEFLSLDADLVRQICVTANNKKYHEMKKG